MSSIADVGAGYWENSESLADPFGQTLKSTAFRAGSYLTDPVCKAHEYFRRFELVEVLHPTAAKVEILARQFFLAVGLVLAAAAALFCTIPGVALRAIAASLETTPFIYERGEAGEIELKEGKFSLLFWNVCFVSGGYSISDGGVLPWHFRIDEVAKKVQERGADVTCLCEVFDINSAYQLKEKLKKEYAHFYFNIGPRALGVSSGIFVASKFEIRNPSFLPFSKEILVDRAKQSEKGIFSFDLQSRGSRFARVHATHLQHSQECAYATDSEKISRAKSMEIALHEMRQVKSVASILVGDLNLDDKEYELSTWKQYIDRGTRNFPHQTWGGDGFCARLVGKRVSGPLNLDHAAFLNGTARGVESSLLETGFDGEIFNPKALSDHEGIYSIIQV